MTHLPYSSAGPYPHEPQELDQVFTVVKRGWLNNVCALINDSTKWYQFSRRLCGIFGPFFIVP
jgi:hypothetical protein